MKYVRVVSGYGLILLLYVTVCLFADRNNGFFDFNPSVLVHLPAVISLALLSYGLRYLRWYLLLKWSGHPGPLLGGWWAYLSGFALTATPGKVGELLRIRYFGRLGVSANRVISAFVFEKALDLLVVFILAAMFIADMKIHWFTFTFTFVSLFVGALVVAGSYIEKLMRLRDYCLKKKWMRLSRLFEFLANAFVSFRFWIGPGPMAVSLVLGGASWSLTAYAFVYLLQHLHIQLPWFSAFSTYPMAMLAGAASMLPGGVGSTEAAIAFQLKWYGVNTTTAVLAAVMIRMGTMWFSILLGLFSIVIQEVQFATRGACRLAKNT